MAGTLPCSGRRWNQQRVIVGEATVVEEVLTEESAALPARLLLSSLGVFHSKKKG